MATWVPLWKAGVKQLQGFLMDIRLTWIMMLSHIISGSVSSKTSWLVY